MLTLLRKASPAINAEEYVLYHVSEVFAMRKDIR
jgi:hypothetical protein